MPNHWTVLHIDEAVEPVDLEAPADLVAITFHTPSAPHAYDLQRTLLCVEKHPQARIALPCPVVLDLTLEPSLFVRSEMQRIIANRSYNRGLLVEGLAGRRPMDSPPLSSSQCVTGTYVANDGQYKIIEYATHE